MEVMFGLSTVEKRVELCVKRKIYVVSSGTKALFRKKHKLLIMLLSFPPRACRLLSEASSSSSELSDARSEAATLVELLEDRQAALTGTLDSQFAEMRASVWQSEDSLQASVQVGAWG